jgi:hypothetical protein
MAWGNENYKHLWGRQTIIAVDYYEERKNRNNNLRLDYESITKYS